MASSGDTSASNYSRSILRVAIAQLCDEIGWQAVEGTALNILVDILEKYILSAGRSTKMWLEHGELLEDAIVRSLKKKKKNTETPVWYKNRKRWPIENDRIESTFTVYADQWLWIPNRL